MSSSPAPHPEAVLPVPAPDREIRVYSHSALFYWWPVWVCGFIMCIVTAIDRGHMAVVPSGSQAVRVDQKVIGAVPAGTQLKTTQTDQKLLVLPGTTGASVRLDDQSNFRMMSHNKNLGVLFATVLLATILVTSVPLRGLLSVVLVLFVVLVIVILALTGWLNQIVNAFGLIDIRISFAGYFAISLVLLIMWALAVFVFDRRMYIAVTSGQVRVCTAIGMGETVYDTANLTFQKRQDDLFRHWIIGLGSGDLVLHRTNVNQEIDFPNVLFIGGKIRQIEKLFKEKEVV